MPFPFTLILPVQNPSPSFHHSASKKTWWEEITEESEMPGRLIYLTAEIDYFVVFTIFMLKFQKHYF